MTEYIVKKGFMAHQFPEKPRYAFGIIVQQLQEAGTMKVIIGKEKKEVILTFERAMEFVSKYGEDKVIRKIKGRDLFIIPINEI